MQQTTPRSRALAIAIFSAYISVLLALTCCRIPAATGVARSGST